MKRFSVGACLFVYVCLFLSVAEISAQQDDVKDEYPDPELKVPLFSLESEEEIDTEEIAHLLTSAAVDRENESNLLKAKCLAIALRVDPVHREAFMANFALKVSRRV